jgi:hypothetical protein
MSKSLASISISNIQNFLNSFKKSLDYSYFGIDIFTNNLVFVNECQLPDMWIKTRKPIDRNDMYVIYDNDEKRNKRVLDKSRGRAKAILTPVLFPRYFEIINKFSCPADYPK